MLSERVSRRRRERDGELARAPRIFISPFVKGDSEVS